MAASNAAEAAGRALRLSPRRASNLERLGNALVMRARIAAALDPGRGDGAAVAALADSADAAFGEALRLAPADGLILTAQARGQLLLRRPERALAAAQRIVALYPAAATGHALEAAALLSLGRSQEAREALILARDARWEEGAEPQRWAVEDLLRAFGRADSAR
jgi:tetratricopeptide (TPR) repeat protein